MALTYESWIHPDIMHSHFHALVALFSFLISAHYVGGRNLVQGAEMDSPQLALDVFQSLFPRRAGAFSFDHQHSHFELFGKLSQADICLRPFIVRELTCHSFYRVNQRFVLHLIIAYNYYIHF